MIRYKKYIFILTAGLFFTGTSCKKYLDVNKNLNDPTLVSVATLLTEAELQLGNQMALGSGLSTGLSVYMHQKTTREQPDGYGMKGDYFVIENTWAGFYNLIVDLDGVINQGTAETRFQYAGIAKILKAYAYSIMVDMWGDIPFSEFNKFKEGNKQPKFDDDAAIYPQLLALIDAGIADINNPAANASVPASDDVIYSGSKTKWIKAANTIKLKLYTQLRKIQNVTPQVTALLASPATLIAAKEENFMLPYGPLGATDDRNPGFGDYVASQRGQCVSPWMYEIMKGINPIYQNIPDPRVPYYWYNQKKPTETADNCTDYRDGGFISLVFGSLGACRNGAQQNSYSLFGIYPVGGRYDDGAGTAIPSASASSLATGAAPFRFLTYADRLYLEAELINTGVVAGDAKAVFTAAMNASMAQVDYMVSSFIKPSQTVPALVGANTTTYINSVLTLYDAGSTAKKLEHIMTQKWLQSYGNSVDQYTDYRRTGYPALFDPRDPVMAPGGFFQPPLNGNPLVIPQAKIPVALSKNFPESLPWSQKEKELNANAPAQKVPESYKIFWKP